MSSVPTKLINDPNYHPVGAHLSLLYYVLQLKKFVARAKGGERKRRSVQDHFSSMGCVVLSQLKRGGVAKAKFYYS